jgi:hypothetical protein
MSKLTLLPEGVYVRQYYLHTRNKIYYVQFTDSVTHKRLTAISTGKTLRDDALMVLAGQMNLSSTDIAKIEAILKDRNLVECIIQKRSAEAETVEGFLTRFWTYDKSPYVAEKKTQESQLGQITSLSVLRG